MSQEETRRRRIPRWLLWPLIGAVVLIAPGVLAILYTEYRFAQKVADLRAQGYPTSYEELQADYDRQKPPPDEDGTELWIEAAKEFEKVSRKLDSVAEFMIIAREDTLGKQITSEEDRAFIASYVEQTQHGVELCKQAIASNRRLYWPTNSDDPILFLSKLYSTAVLQ